MPSLCAMSSRGLNSMRCSKRTPAGSAASAPTRVTSARTVGDFRLTDPTPRDAIAFGGGGYLLELEVVTPFAARTSVPVPGC